MTTPLDTIGEVGVWNNINSYPRQLENLLSKMYDMCGDSEIPTALQKAIDAIEIELVNLRGE